MTSVDIASGETETLPAISRGKLITRRFFSNKIAVGGLAVIIILFLVAFIVPHFLAFHVDDIDAQELAHSPSPRHPFGTNLIGQDVLAQTLSGLQKSLIIAFAVAIISTTVAGTVGAIAGYVGGATDKAITFIIDLLLVVPSFLIISIASTHFKFSSYLFLVVLLSLFSWMLSARMVRGITLSLKNLDYVNAAKYMGEKPINIIFRHILPNMMSVLIADVTLNVGTAVIGEASLSYFGFGVQPPDVSLGTLIADGSQAALSYPWMFLYCGGFLVLLVLASNFVGDGLRDAFDSTSTGGKNG